ncbi:MAG: hypothetical protein ACREJC_20670 [Tepidisphaeraceae bacterium]
MTVARITPVQEFNATPSPAAAVVSPRAASALSTLLTGHLLQDGEVIHLIIKPSLFFIPLSSLRWIAGVLILMISAVLLDRELPGHNSTYLEIGALVIAGRIMWAVLQWMGRLYILTDLRIARLAGVFRVDVFDCPLRKVARTRITRTTRERLLRLGSIEIIPGDEALPVASWQTVSSPVQIHEQIAAAINRARHAGHAP